MRQEAYYCSVKELNELGKENIPPQLISNTHLIYSSPATLAFKARGSGRAGFHHADRSAGLLWQKYIRHQFYAGVSRQVFLSADG